MDFVTLVQCFFAPLFVAGCTVYMTHKLNQHKEEQDRIIREQLEEAKRKQAKEEERDALLKLLTEGLSAVLRDRILQSCNFFITKGYITALALENLTKMHHVYKAMGQNGLCDHSFETATHLPVEPFNQVK